MKELVHTEEKQISVFKTESLFGIALSIYGDANNPLFLAKDVAEWINYAKTGSGSYDVSKMVNTIDEDEKLVRTLFVSGQNREVTLLTENGLYEVLMQSRKPIAKQFKKGVKEILKSIRKTGGYIATTIEDTPELIMAKALQVAQSTIENHKARLQEAEQTISIQSKNIEVAQKQISTLKPKAEFLDKAILTSDTKVDIGQAAKVLKLGYGRTTLFRKLRENGILFKHKNEPKQEFINRGYFEVYETPYERNGRMMLNLKVVVTQEGLYWLNHKLSGNMFNQQMAQFN